MDGPTINLIQNDVKMKNGSDSGGPSYRKLLQGKYFATVEVNKSV